MGTILLGVDALHYAPEATELARELGRATGDKIIVVHVHEFAVGRFGRLQVDCVEGEAEKLITDIRADLTKSGANAEAEIRETHVGRIAKSIIEAADEHDARFIVLGSSHSTDLPHLPVGSVSLRVLHHCRRPSWSFPAAPSRYRSLRQSRRRRRAQSPLRPDRRGRQKRGPCWLTPSSAARPGPARVRMLIRPTSRWGRLEMAAAQGKGS